MEILKTKNRAFRTSFELIIILIIALVLSVFSLSIDLLEKVYAFLRTYTSVSLTKFLITEIFIVLIGLLWIAYRRWRHTADVQKRLEKIIDSINPDVFLVIDPERNILMTNASVKRMFGYEIDEILGKMTDFLYHDRRTKLKHKREIFDILERDGFHFGLATGIKKDGQTIPLEIITGNISHREGAVILIRDITERNLIELELMKTVTELELLTLDLYSNEANYQNILRQVYIGIVVVDREGIVRFANPHALKILGHTKPDFVGGKFGFPFFDDVIHEIEVESADGKKHSIEIHTSQVEWESEIAYLVSIIDITGLQRFKQNPETDSI